MTKENFLHSRSLDAFHLSYPSVNENIFLNLRSLMKQKKSTCRAAFPTKITRTLVPRSQVPPLEIGESISFDNYQTRMISPIYHPRSSTLSLWE